MPKRKFDIDGYYSAIRPRLSTLGGGGGLSTTVPPHHHHATEIVLEPELVQALIAADDVQEGIEELGAEKLARSGEQPWVGPLPLDMAHFSIDNINDADIEGTATVGENVVMTGGVGLAVIDQPRAIHMAGDDADSEARIDGLDRVVFNLTETQGVIQDPSVVLFNPAVVADTNTPQQEAAVSWDSEEKTLVGRVAYDAAVDFGLGGGIEPVPQYDVEIPLGWSMFCCVLGGNPA